MVRHAELPGVKVEICVDNVPLKESDDTADWHIPTEDGGILVVSKYVQSVDGQEFSIRWSLDSTFDDTPYPAISMHVSVDGNVNSSMMVFRNTKQKDYQEEFSNYNESIGIWDPLESETSLKPFRFSKVGRSNFHLQPVRDVIVTLTAPLQTYSGKSWEQILNDRFVIGTITVSIYPTNHFERLSYVENRSVPLEQEQPKEGLEMWFRNHRRGQPPLALLEFKYRTEAYFEFIRITKRNSEAEAQIRRQLMLGGRITRDDKFIEYVDRMQAEKASCGLQKSGAKRGTNTEEESEDDEASLSKKLRTKRSADPIEDIIEKQRQQIKELEQKLKDAKGEDDR